ncbi:MAG: hypothetical protein AB7J13_09415 [Pyrinomonadaceae bacterium]
MQNETSKAEQSYSTLFTVWSALFASQFTFIVILFFIRPELFKFDLTKPLLNENAVIVVALGVASLINIAVSIALRKNFVERAIAESKVELVQTGMIVGCALAEVVSLIGLFLALAFDYQYFFIFSILGTLGMLLHFPKRSTVHAASFRQNE